MPVPLIGLAIGAAGAIGKMFGRGKANRQLRQLMKLNPEYKENPLAKERLGLARTLLNARTPGAAAVERNIFSNQATTMANAGRAATDASQLLSVGAASQAQTNQGLADLGLMETQDYQRRYQNQSMAQEGVIREQDKVYQDKVRRFQDQLAAQGVMSQNRQAGWGDVANMGFGLMDFGMASGFGFGFGPGGRSGAGQFAQQPTIPATQAHTQQRPPDYYSPQINYPVPNFWNRPQ